jgi:uncharacterized protein YkwD
MTSAPPRPVRTVRRPLAVALVAVALLATDLLGSSAAGAVTSKEQAVYSMIANERAGHGLAGLELSDRLSRMAHRHSARMARERRLFHHSCLSCRFRSSAWEALAENVGTAGSIQKVHGMMMGSAGHRSNILGAFTQVGVGVVKKGRRLWVTQIFFA